MSKSTKSSGTALIAVVAAAFVAVMAWTVLTPGSDAGVDQEGPSKPESCADGEAYVEMEFIGDRGSEHYVLDSWHFGSESGTYEEIGGFWERRGCLPLGAPVDVWISGGGTEAAGYGEKTCIIYESGKLVDWTRDGTGEWRTIACEHVVGEPE